MEMKAVLFDLDGVLLDSEGTYSEIWSAIDRRFPTGVANFASVIKGCNLADILRHFPDDGTREKVCAMLDESQRAMRYTFFDGAEALLRQLAAQGVPCALVTSSDNRKMEAVYAQHPWFRQFFDVVITGEMLTRAKPHPDCYLLAAQKLGKEIGECVVVEDSLNGLRAGRAAGAVVAGIASTLPAEVVVPLCTRCYPNLRAFAEDVLA